MALLKELDFGTPIRVSEQLVTLEIDGEMVTVPAGTSIMRAATGRGVAIPKLCATDSVEAFGSCRHAGDERDPAFSGGFQTRLAVAGRGRIRPST
jgi:hypothetical protein